MSTEKKSRKGKSRKGKIPARVQKELAARASYEDWKAGKTPNGKMILDIMTAHKVNGNFKDYVVIVGSRLVEYRRSYDIKLEDGKSLGVNGISLIHKSRLKNVIGDEAAAILWHPILGRAVDVPPATKSHKDIN